MKHLVFGLAALSLVAVPAFAQTKPIVAKKADSAATGKRIKVKAVTAERKTTAPAGRAAKARQASRPAPRHR